jgi:hypothetical protein
MTFPARIYTGDLGKMGITARAPPIWPRIGSNRSALCADHAAADPFRGAAAVRPHRLGPGRGRATGQPSSPLIEKIGSILVRIMPAEPLPGAGDAPLPQLGSYFVRIVTPSGKVGYVPDDTISADDRLCFVKDAAGWKITPVASG